jgi:hypothetical protein
MVANGDADIGKQTATRKPGQPQPVRPKFNAAMAQQCGDSGRGHQSAPQKLLQLVGCREAKAGTKPKRRRDPNPEQR